MRFTDPREMLEAARSHAEANQHEIIQADDVRALTMGFACADCPATDGTIWECHISYIRQLHRDDPLRPLFDNAAGRQALASGLSRGERFFNFEPTRIIDGGVTPGELESLQGLWDPLPAVDWELPRGDGDGST